MRKVVKSPETNVYKFEIKMKGNSSPHLHKSIPDRSRIPTEISFASSLTAIPGRNKDRQKYDEESKHLPNEYFDPGSSILNHAANVIPDSAKSCEKIFIRRNIKIWLRLREQ